MDYKMTIDQVYKQQRPFKMTVNDLLMVSHGGLTKVASVQELTNIVKSQVISDIFELVMNSLSGKLDGIENHIDYIITTIDGVCDEAQLILNDLRKKLNDKKISVKDVINDFMWLLISIINHNPGDKVYPTPEGKYLTPMEFINYINTGKYEYDGVEFESKFINDLKNLDQSIRDLISMSLGNLKSEIGLLLDKKLDRSEFQSQLNRLHNRLTSIENNVESLVRDKVSTETYNAFIRELNTWKSSINEALTEKVDTNTFIEKINNLVSKSDFVKYMSEGYVTVDGKLED